MPLHYCLLQMMILGRVVPLLFRQLPSSATPIIQVCQISKQSQFDQSCQHYTKPQLDRDWGEAPPLLPTRGSDNSGWKGLFVFPFPSILKYVSTEDNRQFPTVLSQVRCTLIPGDGVGPEVSDAVQTVLQVQTVNDSPKVPRFLHQAMGARIDFEEMFFSEVLLAS